MTDRTQEAQRLLGEIRYQVFRPEVKPAREAAAALRAVRDAPVVMVSEWMLESIPEEMNGTYVRLVPVEEQ